MSRRSLITQLRTSGGPSEQLLVQLDRHRVLTSGQLARLTGAPQRTVTYRLTALLGERLVAYARPGREAGSAPRHWWLTPAGTRLVTGTAPAERQRPSGMFAAHAASIAEVWLALLEHGPTVGIRPDGWWPDRAAWSTWTTPGRGEQTLTPDAVVTAWLAAGETVAAIEVDLATMTQTRLREKLGRYLAYADDRAWTWSEWPHCPPLLLLTTTEARARTFVAAAAKEIGRGRRRRGPDYRWSGYGQARADVGEAERLVIAACGHVRDPGPAVTDPVWWMIPADPTQPPEPVTLAGLLAGRVAAQQVAAGWYQRVAADQAAAHRAVTLDEIRSDGGLAELLGDERAADVLPRLLAQVDRCDTEHPGLTDQLLAWWPHRHDPTAAAVAAVRAVLVDEHALLWAEQARTVLAAPRSPRLAVAAATLGEGRLLTDLSLGLVVDGPHERQAAAVTDQRARYTAARDQAVTTRWDALGWRARRRTDRTELAAAYDNEQLLVCDLCAAAVPRRAPADPAAAVRWDWPDVDDVDQAVPGDGCPVCRTGHLLPYPQRDQVPTLDQRLAQVRARLVSGRLGGGAGSGQLGDGGGW